MLRNSVHTRTTPKICFARSLRNDQTPGELALWKKIRRKKFHGLKFRRQVPIGPYIVDFLCVEKQLVIEIDGDSHYDVGAEKRDGKRERYLIEQGFSVLRLSNRQVAKSIDVALDKMRGYLGILQADPLSLALPRRGRGYMPFN